MINLILSAKRPVKRLVSITYDLLAIQLAIYLALALRYGTFSPEVNQSIYAASVITSLISVTVFIKLGLYRAVVRFMTGRAFTTLAIGIGISAVALATTSFLIPAEIPRSSVIIYFFTAFALLGTPRLFVRSLVSQLSKGSKEPVIIYGAGQQGVALASSLTSSSSFRPIVFIDDDSRKQNTYG